MLAAPGTVEIDGEQLLLGATGNSSSGVGQLLARWSSTPQRRSPPRLLAFKLGGNGSVPPMVVQEFPKPPLPRP